jgi:cob(I)alamin adenosyltransferase
MTPQEIGALDALTVAQDVHSAVLQKYGVYAESLSHIVTLLAAMQEQITMMQRQQHGLLDVLTHIASQQQHRTEHHEAQLAEMRSLFRVLATLVRQA